MFKSVFEEGFTVIKNDHGTNESKNISFSKEWPFPLDQPDWQIYAITTINE